MASEFVTPFPSLIGQKVRSETKEIALIPTHVKPQRLDDRATDEQLMAAVANSDKEALASLFKRHGRAVLNVAHRILRDASEAADLRQEVFLYLYQRAHLYNPVLSSPISWIIQITYHRAISRRRYLSHRQHYLLHQLDEEKAVAQRSVPDLTSLDARKLLHRLRHQITPIQRMTLEMHLFDGYTFREIAELTDQSVGNVRNHYYRGIERLRKLIFDENSARNEATYDRSPGPYVGRTTPHL